MKSHTRVVVIGGGVVGCSVLYHLTRLGWNDVMLIERSELTSGSTWHAAGGFHTLNADTNMAALQGYTIRLYRELEEATGLSCGLHHVGGLTLASTPERMDFLMAERAKHRYMGLETEIVGPSEIARISPITNIEGVIGALYDPLDGHLDPSGTTQAYARAARDNGAEVVLRNPVIELTAVDDGWQVVTEQGTVVAEHVVNAAGLWAREVGELVGVDLPLHPMEHQYLVTDDIPEVFNHGGELPHVMDPEGESYLRQEGRGLVIGFYEQQCDPWAVNGTPSDFGHELLPDNLDRIGDALQTAFTRYPVLAQAGIKQIINGPFTFAPDGNPLVGPVPGRPGYWCACAVMAGFSQGGGVGLTLAEWMVDGEPSRDVFAMDVARFGNYPTRAWTREKVRENYRRRFSVSYPNEELPVGRELNTTPAYGLWKSKRAVFGSGYGLEHVNYFALPGDELKETPSFRRSNAFTATGEECHGVRTAVGINEIHNFAKYEVTGSGAKHWLDTLMAGRVPSIGRMSLAPMLSPKGRIIGDFTIARLADDSFRLTASYSAQAYHMRWFESHLPNDDSVRIVNRSLDWLGFQIAGPNARELLSRVTETDVSNAALPFMGIARLPVGLCDATVQRVTYTGDLGYEIYVPAAQQIMLYNLLENTGQDLGLKPFGMRAMMSLRLEKSFGSWQREFRPDFTPAETLLDRFVAYGKAANFIGKDAAIEATQSHEAERRSQQVFVVDADDADAVADEPIFHRGEVIGFITSGGYAHYCGASVAIGMIPLALVDEGLEVEIEILGERRAARMISQPLLDPKAERMRS
ncbi:MAG: glycine cleavage system protein T [marine bacterium B5-7]|nr:MAG: glycine cleavage system protein T [marine bacterium B5-7]